MPAKRIGSLLACLIMFSCSPGHFIGSSKSERKLPRYRQISQECRNLHLSGSQMTVQSFRGLFGCLGSNGLFGPAGEYIKSSSDEQLGPLVKVINEGILANPRRFFELKTTFENLQSSERIDSLFNLAAEFLEHFHRSIVPFARLGERGGGEFPELQKIIRWSAYALEPQNTKEGLAFLHGLTNSKAFHALTSMNLTIDAEWLKDFRNFWKDELKNNSVERLLKAVADGTLYKVVDPYVASLNNGKDSELSQFLSLWKFFWAENRGLEITEYFFYSNQPLRCFRGNTELKSYSGFVLGEIAKVGDLRTLSDYCRRIFSTGIFLGRAVCEFPSKVHEYSDVIHSFSRSMALDPIMRFVRRVDQASPELLDVLHDLLVQFGNPAGGTYGFFKKLEDQDVWRNFILVTLLQGNDSRGFASRLAQSLISGDGNDKPIRLLATLFANANEKQLKNWFEEMKPVWDFVFDRLPKWSSTVESYFLENRIHPIAELVRVSLDSFSEDSQFLKLLLEERNESDFDSSLKFLANMARSGQLKEIAFSIFKIFEELSERGAYAYDPVAAEKVQKFSIRHQYSASDFQAESFALIDIPISSACDQMDMSFDIKDFNRIDYQNQFNLYLKCLDSRGSYPKLSNAMGTWLRSPPTSSRPRLTFLIEDLQFVANRFTDLEVRELLFAIRTGYQEKKWDQFAEAFQSWSEFKDDDENTTLKLFIDWLNGFVKEGSGLNSALTWVSQALQFDGLQEFLKAFWKWKDSPKTELPKVSLNFDRGQLENWVNQIECDRARARGTTWVKERARELQSELINNVNAWEWNGDGPRKAWNFSDFWKHLHPVLERVKNLNEQAPSHLVYSIRNILRMFGRAEGAPKDRYHLFTSNEFMTWMQKLSRDHRLITYYYPGQSIPHARLVNGFDRLEIILYNADLVPFFRKNMGLKYLDQLAYAWGDEPREVWPAEIRQKYSRGNPPTLRETYQSIYNDLKKFRMVAGSPRGLSCWAQASEPMFSDLQFERELGELNLESEDESELTQYLNENGLRKSNGVWVDAKGEVLKLTKDGLPFIPKEYQERLFNAFQVISVFEENLPNERGEGGIGMRVLRNLAFEIMNSTPIRDRDSSDGFKNNLSLIISLGRVGLLRHLGWAMSETPTGSDEVRSLFELLAALADHPEFEEIAKAVFQQPESVARWERALRSLFELMDSESEFAHKMRRSTIYFSSFFSGVLGETSLGQKEALFRILRAWGPALRAQIPELLNSKEHIDLIFRLISDDPFWDRPLGLEFRGKVVWINSVLSNREAFDQFSAYFFDRFFDGSNLSRFEKLLTMTNTWSDQTDLNSFGQILSEGLLGGNSRRDELASKLWKSLGELMSPGRENTQIWIEDFKRNPNAYYQALSSVGELAADGDQNLFFRIFMGLTDSLSLTEVTAPQ